MDTTIFSKCTGFDWDNGSQYKNQAKHGVTHLECEQVFFNTSLLLYEDLKHSKIEKRYYMLGKTDHNRSLFVVFTIRKPLIRVISPRDMNRKERKIHEQAQENT